MAMQPELIEALARTLEYPTPDTAAQALAAADGLAERSAPADDMAKELRALVLWLEGAEVGMAEERYSRLFDLKPVCTLNLGWHLFGDTYQRGALLAGLAGELTLHGVQHRHDLPDYLPTLLRLLAAFDDPEHATVLVHAVLLPALVKLKKALEHSDNPWSPVLNALTPLLEREIPKGRVDVPAPRRALEVLQC
jgi:nitrate reductase delta subunit